MIGKMEFMINAIVIIGALNLCVMLYLGYLYFRDSKNTLQDEGTADTKQED